MLCSHHFLHTSMPHELGKAEIERLLAAQDHGHLGCCADNEPYVVPISYVLDGHSLLGYTHAGRKIDMLRKNPRACVQVDDIGPEQWLSVIVSGDFEELTGNERHRAIGLLGKKISHPKSSSQPFIRDEIIGDASSAERMPIIYRIHITSMTGRMFGGSAGAD